VELAETVSPLVPLLPAGVSTHQRCRPSSVIAVAAPTIWLGMTQYCKHGVRGIDDVTSRDCLAAPGSTVDSAVAPNPNKNKTCYKCQQEGHVRRVLLAVLRWYSPAIIDRPRLPGEC
jgi:hypothetical protein